MENEMVELEQGLASLIIEDDDGFTTQWPWPEDETMLGSTSFVDLCLTMHEAKRRELHGMEEDS